MPVWQRNLVQQFAVVFHGDFFHIADGPTGNDHLGVFTAHGQLNGVILDALDGAIDAADGADAVAGLQRGQHVFDLLVLLFLGTDQEEVEHHEHQDQRQQHPEHFHQAGVSGGGGSVSGGGRSSAGGGFQSVNRNHFH